MGKASSSKKIKRVQQAGASRTPGQRRQLGYPALIGAILVVGLVLTAFAVSHRRTVEQVSPAVGESWVAGYGTYICDGFVDNPETVEADAPADLHSDGLIHIHPTAEDNAGENAVFGLFTNAVGIQVGDGTLTLPDGTPYADGDDCNGEPGRVALYVWPPQAGENTDPRVITTGIPATRFTDDGQTFVLAFAPRGAEVPLPPSADRIDDPDDTEPTVADAPATTTTVAAGDTSTTVAGGATTVPPGGGETPTTAGG